MPLSQIVGVVALLWIASGRAKVIEVSGGLRGVVFVVANARAGTLFVAAPGGIVALRKLGGSTGLVGVVAQGVDGARDVLKQLGRGLIARASTVGYIPRSDQHRIADGDRCSRQVEGEKDESIAYHEYYHHHEGAHRGIEHLEEPSRLGTAFFCPRSSKQGKAKEETLLPKTPLLWRTTSENPVKANFAENHLLTVRALR